MNRGRHSRIRLKWVAAILFAATLVGLLTPRAARSADLAEVKRRGELRWGGDLQGGEPYVFEDERAPGKIRGFEVDIADALARRLGVRARFRQTDWSSLVPALERGDFDVILNGLEDTPVRRKALLLSSPYFVYGETLAVRRDAPYQALGDLAGKRVGTLNQTVAHDLLEAQPVEVVLYEGQQEPYLDLAQGRTEAVLLDHIIADRFGCVLPAIRCVPGDVARGFYVLGTRKQHRALRDALDGALSEMKRDGELQRILSNWKLWDERQRGLQDAAAPSQSGALQLDTEASRTEPSNQAVVDSSVGDLRGRRREFGMAQLSLFLEASLMTLALSVASFLLACGLGLGLAIARLYGRPLLRGAAHVYIELFRGTPLLLQLYVLYFGIAEYVRLGPITAAILGLGLNYAAYEAEVHRGALLALPRGQSEAARALGLGRWQTLRHVLLPQSLRNSLPAVTNDFVALLKDSSLVSVITVVELTKRMTIVAADLRDWVLPGALCALLYLAMSLPLTRLSRSLERRLHYDSHPRAV